MTEASNQQTCPKKHESMYLSTMHFADARISISSCDSCGWVDTDKIIRDVLEKFFPELFVKASAYDRLLEITEKMSEQVEILVDDHWDGIPSDATSSYAHVISNYIVKLKKYSEEFAAFKASNPTKEKGKP